MMNFQYLRQVRILNTYLQIAQGDITEERVDAIVNAANVNLKHGAGVAGAIAKKGGPRIQEESNAHVHTHGQVPTGQTAVTSGGSLYARFVIHAVGPIFNGVAQHPEKLLGKAIYNSLETANRLEIRSLAIPAISSGIYGCPKDVCARIFMEVVSEWIKTHETTQLEYVRLTNIDTPTVNAFEAAFDKYFPKEKL
mmetsp:Transcript_24315/g.43236  ORF Transcript_24315/g.43236 Transcript_24315/m.43236 type:complete len:195 (-) Transcript_24315:1065-1649(-)